MIWKIPFPNIKKLAEKIDQNLQQHQVTEEIEVTDSEVDDIYDLMDEY